MTKRVKKFWETCKPIYIISRITGTIALERNESGELTKSYSQSTLSILYSIIFTIPAFIYYEGNVHFISNLDVSTTIYISSEIYVFVHTASLITVPILTNCFTKKLITIIETLSEIDKKLEETISCKNLLLETNYSIWKHSIFGSIFCPVYIILPNLFVLITHQSPIIIVANYTATMLINSTIKLQCYFATRILYYRFKTLNSLLRVLVDRSEQSTLNEKSFQKSLKEISKLHKDLVGLSRSVNDIFSFPLLFQFILYVLGLLNSSYFVTYKFVSGDYLKPDIFFLLINIFLVLILNLIELFVLIRSTALMCSEVST